MAISPFSRTSSFGRDRVTGLLAVAIGAVALVVGGSASFVIVSLLGIETTAALKIVDAILAGSAVATAVAAVITGGIGAAAIATIRWAVSQLGRKEAAA
ncbi:uberolysin/carnocyclin family circular bacteriocin [Pseudonocardia hydrocarbonoxydans]|uniref:Circular bacteriocin, circularin A/uberolysin family n=1 Tax=Pseudonocardia hydrocarbonoxydans TaxID=76726 RepID=A0A4Y3WTC6_9PSEU|nr:uberolysin/carnocyclin family circular bacteriocin [Pseudonocardia hydrocarbonoxydans]GEC22024.1 hypothetical protein PHY01_43070 [Pseudonocardia hydrocarbonoxydans]